MICMLLSHYEFDSPLKFDEGSIPILIIENPSYMTKFIGELLSQSNKGEGGFELFENDVSVSISDKVEIIINPFSANVNEREILNKLYAVMKKDALDEELFLDTNTFLSDIETNVKKIMARQSIPLDSDTPDIIGLFKLLGVCFVVPDSLLEKICDYIDICSEYLKTKLFIFVNLKSFLNESEIIQLYNHLNYHKTHILMIESSQSNTLENESIRVIDEALCEISISGCKDNDIY